MKAKEFTKQFLENFESYVCQILLSFFVLLLFIQIIFREVFNYTLSWGEELARFAFVWFVFFDIKTSDTILSAFVFFYPMVNINIVNADLFNKSKDITKLIEHDMHIALLCL